MADIAIKEDEILRYEIPGANFAQDLYNILITSNKRYYIAKYNGNRYFRLKENATPNSPKDYYIEITNNDNYKKYNYVVELDSTLPNKAVEPMVEPLPTQNTLQPQAVAETQQTANVSLVDNSQIEVPSWYTATFAPSFLQPTEIIQSDKGMMKQVRQKWIEEVINRECVPKIEYERLLQDNAYTQELLTETAKRLAGAEQDRDLLARDNEDYEARYNDTDWCIDQLVKKGYSVQLSKYKDNI